MRGRLGHIAYEVHRLAEEDNCDLIVVGCHGRHGFGLLLGGSTANGVLHGAKTDVLAMHVCKTDEHGG
ncbi:MAG: universal stress protein [Motiliproteus sp.]